MGEARMLTGDDFEDMQSWREWTSNKPSMSMLHDDLLRWWSKGQLMSTELSRLKAELDEAREIITQFLLDHTEDQEEEIRQGIAQAMDLIDTSRIDVTHPIVRRARAFIDKAGK